MPAGKLNIYDVIHICDIISLTDKCKIIEMLSYLLDLIHLIHSESIFTRWKDETCKNSEENQHMKQKIIQSYGEWVSGPPTFPKDESLVSPKNAIKFVSQEGWADSIVFVMYL